MWLIGFFLKLQGADNGSDSVNPAESWNFFRKRGGKANKGKKEKHNKENSKVLGVPLSKHWHVTVSIFEIFSATYRWILFNEAKYYPESLESVGDLLNFNVGNVNHTKSCKVSIIQYKRNPLRMCQPVDEWKNV